MNNIFQNAYFSKPYKTRDGRKALYLFSTGCGVYCITENFHNKTRYYHFNGIPYDFEFSKYRGEGIVSEWTFDDEKLDILAWNNADSLEIGKPITINDVVRAYKAGFRAKGAMFEMPT